MAEPEWTELAEAAGCACWSPAVSPASRRAGCRKWSIRRPPKRGERSDESMQRLDRHRGVLERRALEVIPPAAAAVPHAAAGFAQAPQGAGTPPARKPLP